jgi:AcrR family transcriptional regulator
MAELRADARRNRSRVLAAAATVFAAQGVSASTEEVARAAGVGVGTVFRHFPTKEALLLAVYEARLDELADKARSLADAADPGAAFEDFFRTVVASSGTKLAVVDALAAGGIDVRTASPQHGLGDALRVLLRRAQHAGRVRSDVGLADVMALLAGTSRAVQVARTDDVRRRAVDVVLSGLIVSS